MNSGSAYSRIGFQGASTNSNMIVLETTPTMPINADGYDLLHNVVDAFPININHLPSNRVINLEIQIDQPCTELGSNGQVNRLVSKTHIL